MKQIFLILTLLSSSIVFASGAKEKVVLECSDLGHFISGLELVEAGSSNLIKVYYMSDELEVFTSDRSFGALNQGAPLTLIGQSNRGETMILEIRAGSRSGYLSLNGADAAVRCRKPSPIIL